MSEPPETPGWTDEHERLLSAAVPPAVYDDDLDALWVRVAPAPPSRRRWRVGVAAGAAAVLLGSSGVAAAGLWTSRTGEGPIDAEDLRLGGPGERLQLAAPDYARVVEQETRDIPFPSRRAREVALAEQARDGASQSTDSYVAVGAVRAWVADQALCSWANTWAVALNDGDDVSRDEAVAAVRAAPGWAAVSELDPEPYARWERIRVTDADGTTSTRRVRDDSQFFYLAELGRVIGGTDVERVASVLAENNGYCRADQNVPDLPTADPSVRWAD